MDSELDHDEETGRNPLRDRMKQLESENAELKARAEEASAAARELAFVKAGVDPNLPIAKYFMRVTTGNSLLRQSGKQPSRPKSSETRRKSRLLRKRAHGTGLMRPQQARRMNQKWIG